MTKTVKYVDVILPLPIPGSFTYLTAIDLDLNIDDQHMLSSHVEKLFWAPISVKIDQHGKIYVVDRNRHRIQVYSKKYLINE